MEKTKVLFVSQQIEPYTEDGHMANIARNLPQRIQERGKEIRTFMPRFGCINERRYQLHEVIRLSGMNLIINDSDHPLIIKVASIQAARMQVYFIDNEEFFKRKTVFEDERGKFHKDNDERMIFFCRGVIETVKKLGWAPDIVHCHGWMTSLMPYYLKNVFHEDPVFQNTRVVYSVYDNGYKGSLNKNLANKLEAKDTSIPAFTHLGDPTYDNLNKFAMEMSDAVIVGGENVSPELQKCIQKFEKPVVEFSPEEEYADKYSDLYDELMQGEAVLGN